MKAICVQGILLIVTLLTITGDVQAECTWGQAVHDALQARDVMIANLKAFRTHQTLERTIDLLLSLDELPSQIADLEKLDSAEGELDERLIRVLVEQPREPIVKKLRLFRYKGFRTGL